MREASRSATPRVAIDASSIVGPRTGVGHIITVHDLYFMHAPEHVEPYGGGYFRQTFGHGLPRVDHIIAVSRFTREELLKFYSLDPSRISIVPHGVDLQRFKPRAEAN